MIVTLMSLISTVSSSSRALFTCNLFRLQQFKKKNQIIAKSNKIIKLNKSKFEMKSQITIFLVGPRYVFAYSQQLTV